MQASRSHLYFVTDDHGGSCRKKLPRVERVIGIVAMEDLIEELISVEIIDESDTVTDNISKKKVNTRGQRRIEFFEMLQVPQPITPSRLYHPSLAPASQATHSRSPQPCTRLSGHTQPITPALHPPLLSPTRVIASRERRNASSCSLIAF